MKIGNRIRGPRLGTKLMLWGLVLLIVPWISYRQLIGMERLLIQGQSQAQLLTAEGISTLFNGREDLFNDLPIRIEDYESLVRASAAEPDSHRRQGFRLGTRHRQVHQVRRRCRRQPDRRRIQDSARRTRRAALRVHAHQGRRARLSQSRISAARQRRQRAPELHPGRRRRWSRGHHVHGPRRDHRVSRRSRSGSSR